MAEEDYRLKSIPAQPTRVHIWSLLSTCNIGLTVKSPRKDIIFHRKGVKEAARTDFLGGGGGNTVIPLLLLIETLYLLERDL